MESFKLNVRSSFTPNPVFIDGISRCGKGAVGYVLSSLNRTEHIKNRFVYDMVQNYYEQGWLAREAAMEQIIIETDFELYYSLLGRSLNWNKHDWSSVYNSKNRLDYYNRLSRKDTERTAKEIFELIETEKLISLNTAEELLFHLDLYDECFSRRNKTILVLRHPIEVVFSWHRTNRGTRFGSDKRFLHPTFMFKASPVPLDACGWEMRFLESTPLFRVIQMVDLKFRKYFQKFSTLTHSQKDRTVLLPFEDFSLNFNTKIIELAKFLGSSLSPSTDWMAENQRLPRELNYPDLAKKLAAIYHNTSTEEFEVFRKLCWDYESAVSSVIKLDEIQKVSIDVSESADFNKYVIKPNFNYGKREN